MSPILNKEANKGSRKQRANHSNIDNFNISKQSAEGIKGQHPSETILGPTSAKLHNSENANIMHMVPNLKNGSYD